MIALLQRVTRASVVVADRTVGAIDQGLLVFLGVERGDSTAEADRLLERLLGYRVFGDANQRMNLSVQEVRGGVLLVPQFTLAADTSKGMRPGFQTAAEPAEGRRLFDYFVSEAKKRHMPVAIGEFGADMQVSLVNDGPVTFWIQTAPANRTLITS